MSVNKYVGDYRLIEDVDEKGRIRTRTEYKGDLYHYRTGETPERHRTAAAAAALWALWILAMLLPSSGMRVFYVSLPFICSAPALFILSDTVRLIVCRKEPMEHRDADRINNRYPSSLLFAQILLAVSLAGEGLCLVLEGWQMPGDALLAACAAVMLGLCIRLFGRRHLYVLEPSAVSAALTGMAAEAQAGSEDMSEAEAEMEAVSEAAQEAASEAGDRDGEGRELFV